MLYEFNSGKINMSMMKFISARKHNVFCSLHIHRHIELVLVWEGSLDMEICQKRYTLHEHDLLFINPYEPHSYFSTTLNHAAVIEFIPSFYPALWTHLQAHRTDTRITRLPQEVSALVHAILPDNTETSHFTGISDTHAHAILAPLCHALITGNRWEDESVIQAEQDLFLRALPLIDENHRNPITREWVAEQLSIRPETVSRLFTRHSGMTFVKYLQYMRLYDAIAAMNNGISITDAALSAGFGSISGFNRVFLQCIGCTPSEYLKQNDMLF